MKIKSVKTVKIPVQVVLGETELSVEEISGLSAGSIVALESLAGEPVNFVAAGNVIAKGEVVVIDEAFGIRLTSVDTQE